MDQVDHFLANLHFVGDGEFIFGVPLGTPAELRARLFTAWKSYGRGILSMDETLEKHREAWNFDRDDRTELQIFVDEIVLPARDEVLKAAAKFAADDAGPYPKLGQLAAGVSLMRLNTTFTVLALLTRYGYGFEAAGVARLILEQLAWSYAVRDGEDKSILNVMPQSSIGRLKALLPWSGRMYGHLSEYAHIKPELGGEFVDEVEMGKEKGIAVFFRRPEGWSPMLAWCYALLADGFVITAETVLPVKDPTATKVENGKVELLPDRPTAQLLAKASPHAPFDPNNP